MVCGGLKVGLGCFMDFWGVSTDRTNNYKYTKYCQYCRGRIVISLSRWILLTVKYYFAHTIVTTSLYLLQLTELLSDFDKNNRSLHPDK